MNRQQENQSQKVGNKFKGFYEAQIAFQEMLIEKLYDEQGVRLPSDKVEWFKYHTLAMIEEIGEVLESDKRWKTHRNELHKQEDKLDELADVFITFMNMCIFSGFDCETIERSIEKKIRENITRVSGD